MSGRPFCQFELLTAYMIRCMVSKGVSSRTEALQRCKIFCRCDSSSAKASGVLDSNSSCLMSVSGSAVIELAISRKLWRKRGFHLYTVRTGATEIYERTVYTWCGNGTSALVAFQANTKIPCTSQKPRREGMMQLG